MTRLVVLGDSTAEGLEDPYPHGGYRGWADRLAEHLERAKPGVLYANLAVRGRVARQVRDEQLPAAVSLRPDVAVVAAGVNDVLRPSFDPAALTDDLLALHGELRAVGAEVLAFTMPDMARVAPLARLLRPRLHALNEALATASRETGSRLVDLSAHPFAADPRLWHTDRLHANALGHERLAAAMADELGLPVDGPAWSDPLPPAPAAPLPAVVVGEARWLLAHAGPWIWRRVTGRSSGDGVVCKRPELEPVSTG